MDILSHGLWGSIAFGRKNRRSFWLAFFFGFLPDFIPFAPFFLLMFLGVVERPHFNLTPPDLNVFPDFIYELYNITHSLIVFALVFFIVWVFLKRPFWELVAWGLHIIMDIFTHVNEFFPTPFLWPISDVTISGRPWASPEIFIPNILLLAVLYIWFFVVRLRKRSTGADTKL